MITADTLTEAQIVDAWCTLALDEQTFGRITMVLHARGLAVGPCFRDPTVDEIRAARAQCADLLNKRGRTC